MEFSELEKKYPFCYKTALHLQNKANFFRLTIPRLFHLDYDFELSERICKTAFEISSNNWNEYFVYVEELVKLSREFLELQIELEKTGKYRYSTFEEVVKNVYLEGNQSGPDYLWGLYFSEAFWKIHHYLTNFFLKNFISNNKDHGSVLDIPLGNGFFLSEFLRKNSQWKGVGIDFSKKATILAQKIFNANEISRNSYQISNEDFFNFSTKEKFDRIICGEFLEHVEDPLKVLEKINYLLKKGGRVFLTAAVWAANPDHIYLYKSSQEVRNHIKKAGFIIEKELVQAVFEKDQKNPEKEKIPVNYTAILRN